MDKKDALSVIPTHPRCLWQPSQETGPISFCGTRKHLAHSGTRCFKDGCNFLTVMLTEAIIGFF